MSADYTGELVWYRHGKSINVGVLIPDAARQVDGGRGRMASLGLDGLTARPLRSTVGLNVVYRQPIALYWRDDHWHSGPAFAILAGSGPNAFAGSRTNFRDIMRVGAQAGKLIYVLPAGNVSNQPVWRGFVRLGYQRWVDIPCPRPSAIYNRIPTRNMERTLQVTSAKNTLHTLGIPLFNPSYFNKKIIYAILENSVAQRYLPETSRLEGVQSLNKMIRPNGTVYLKPTGGSLGHGIIRVDWHGGANHYQLSVLKNSNCNVYEANNLASLWQLVRIHRLLGEYVIQVGKPLIQVNGRPCDFRVLVQKTGNEWQVAGVGVRVAGPNTITTHVPNGGSIADAKVVLDNAFGRNADTVEAELENMVCTCARVIDAQYSGHLGEMSMDVGLDEQARLWFFEANAKPMKFDEPHIRDRSIKGVIHHLEYLAANR